MSKDNDNQSRGIYIRCYAQDDKYWDDGIGYVIAADEVDVIDRYVENLPWKVHPYQTFYVDDLYTNFVMDLTLAREID